MRAIIQFFTKEHLFGNLITIVIILFGLSSLYNIRRDIWPNVDYNITTITAFMGGAAPKQIEKLLINPIEAAVKEVDGLKNVFATAAESTAVVTLKLDPDARNPDKTNSDLQRAVDRIDDLPSNIEKPIVTAIEATQMPVIEVTVGGTASNLKQKEAAKFISDELSLIPGVARVTKLGYLKTEYVVTADPVKLSQRRVSLSSLISSIAARNVTIPAGTVDASVGVESLVRTEGQYINANEILNTVIQSNEVGFGTTIGDVATVKTDLEKPKVTYRAMGKKSINLVVAKKSNADALDVVNRIKERIVELKKNIPKEIELGISNDFSIYLKNRLGALGANLGVGLLLVVLVLSLFLPLPVTLVVALGIPVALLSTIAATYLLGNSLNLVSLIGLIIVLGMLVDDAIVVSENIWRHIETGENLTSSIVNGASEVFGPVLASILTTASAFGPMMFMSGIFGAFIFEIPMMVILALFFSLLEAFFIMPSHFNSWISNLIRIDKYVGAQKKRHWFDGVVMRYKKYVSWSLNHRYKLTFFVIFLLVGTGGLMTKMGRFVLFPSDGIELFFITAEAPIGTNLEKMNKLVAPIEDLVKTLPESELKDFVTSIGIIQQEPADPFTKRGTHFANVRISLTAQRNRKATASDIVERLRKKLGDVPGLTKVNFEFARQGPPQGRPISFNVKGQDFEAIKRATDEIKEEIAKVAGVVDIQDNYLPGKDEWQVMPRFHDTAMAGLSASEISQSVRAAFEGFVASSIRRMDEEIEIRVRLKQKNGDIQNQLENLKIGNRSGHLIPLKNVADFKMKKTINSVQHADFRRVIGISAGIEEKVTTAREATALVKPIVDKVLQKHKTLSVSWEGEDKDTAESMESLGRAFIFAAMIIFILLVITFKNMVQPLVILTSIPLGFLGVAYAMLLHNKPFSFMAMLGVIALAGVIVNNAIVFIDFVNSQRKMGKKSSESIIEAASIRLRPIVLTTLTTIFGLLPTAYGEALRDWVGIGGSDPFIVPIALALGWGLAFGTLMTGLFFPAFVRVLDDVQFILGKSKSLFKRTSPNNHQLN